MTCGHFCVVMSGPQASRDHIGSAVGAKRDEMIIILRHKPKPTRCGPEWLPLRPSCFLGPTAAVATGDYHTCAVTQNGQLRCFGDNSDGQNLAATTTRCCLARVVYIKNNIVNHRHIHYNHRHTHYDHRHTHCHILLILK